MANQQTENFGGNLAFLTVWEPRFSDQLQLSYSVLQCYHFGGAQTTKYTILDKCFFVQKHGRWHSHPPTKKQKQKTTNNKKVLPWKGSILSFMNSQPQENWVCSILEHFPSDSEGVISYTICWVWGLKLALWFVSCNRYIHQFCRWFYAVGSTELFLCTSMVSIVSLLISTRTGTQTEVPVSDGQRHRSQRGDQHTPPSVAGETEEPLRPVLHFHLLLGTIHVQKQLCGTVSHSSGS